MEGRGVHMSKKEMYEARTEELITPILDRRNFELVDVEYVKEGSSWYLRVYIDKEGGKVASILTMINHVNDYPTDLTGKKVVVIGGGAVGLDVVEFFAPRGADVSIVEMMPIIGNGIDPVSKDDMGTLMKKYGVHQMPNTALKEVRPDNFLVEADGELKELPFDYGFVCLGMKAENPVLQQVKNAFEDDQNIEIVNIGDSVRARRIIEGTEEGRNILNVLAKHDYL